MMSLYDLYQYLRFLIDLISTQIIVGGEAGDNAAVMADFIVYHTANKVKGAVLKQKNNTGKCQS